MQTMDPRAAEASAPPEVTFDPYTPEFDLDPYPTYRMLRERDPVHWWPVSQAWLVSRYDDVAQLLRDRRFSHRYADWELARPRAGDGPAAKAFTEVFEHGLFTVDDAAHARLRKLVSPAFTPRAIEQRRAQIERVVHGALDRLAASERPDVATYADEVPVRVMESILDIPTGHERTFREFAVAVTGAMNVLWLSAEEFEAMVAPIPAGVALVRELVDERRRRPRGDLLSALVQVEEEGERLSTAELIALVAALIIAGSETTVHAIAFGTWTLLRHPDQLRVFRSEPPLRRGAIDELLRYDLFGRIGIPRFALEDVTLRGRSIRKGQMALLMMSSALRDESYTRDPDRLDLRRDNGQTLLFGSGPHYCLGASLARLEADVALGALLDRFPRLALDGAPTFAPHLTMRKLGSLPVRIA